MAPTPADVPRTNHLERTAAEARDETLHPVVLESVDEVNDQIRLFRFGVSRPLQFRPGQWVDLYIPGVPKAGGFSITSTPGDAAPGGEEEAPGFLELAVQRSPANPHAAWLWRDPPSALLGRDLTVRVGGSFVWPPPGLGPEEPVRRVVLVAGGVGVNPLVSVLGALAEQGRDVDVRFLYSLRDPGAGRREARRMPFLDRIAGLLGGRGPGRVQGQLQLFLTGGGGGAGREAPGEVVMAADGGVKVPVAPRRMTVRDVEEAVGGRDGAREAVVYVCGVPGMTDRFVDALTADEGLAMERGRRVLCEKWW